MTSHRPMEPVSSGRDNRVMGVRATTCGVHCNGAGAWLLDARLRVTED